MGNNFYDMIEHMETTQPILTPPMLPKERMGKCKQYVAVFVSTLMKTLAVGFGIFIIVLGAGMTTLATQETECNVSVRTLYGDLLTYSHGGDETDAGALVRGLARDENDENIKAIVLDIDSPGGYPVAGEEVADQLARLSKPNVAVIRSVGASAAYWAATGADQIFASRSSDVGSIGVIVSFPDESEKNKSEGIAFNEISSGKFKNIGTPNRPITAEEKSLIERDIKEIFEHFVSVVAVARHLDIEKVRALADGSTMTGKRAKEEGLIDAIGGFEEAKEYLRDKIDEEPVFCAPDSETFLESSSLF